MNLQKLLSYTRRAVDDYGMIESGDKIAVGISGGKDSLALLYALNGLKRFYPNPFTIEAITVSVFKEMDLTPIKALCEELNVPYTVISTEIGEIVFKERKEEYWYDEGDGEDSQGNFYVSVVTDNEEKAIKIGAERRAMRLAQKNGL